MMVRLLLVLALGVPLYGQTGAANGEIRGFIRDPNEAAVAGAQVSARNLDTGFERGATSNAEGEFELPLLPLGRYEVVFTAAGMKWCLRRPVLHCIRRAVSR